jgi:hypothetical protein
MVFLSASGDILTEAGKGLRFGGLVGVRFGQHPKIQTARTTVEGSRSSRWPVVQGEALR